MSAIPAESMGPGRREQIEAAALAKNKADEPTCAALSPQERERALIVSRRVEGAYQLLVLAATTADPGRRAAIVPKEAADLLQAGGSPQDRVARALNEGLVLPGGVLSAFLRAREATAPGMLFDVDPRGLLRRLGSYRGFSPILFYRRRVGLARVRAWSLEEEAAEFGAFIKAVDAKLDTYSHLAQVNLRCVFPRYHNRSAFTAAELDVLATAPSAAVFDMRALRDSARYQPARLLDDLPEQGESAFEQLQEALHANPAPWPKELGAFNDDMRRRMEENPE